MTRIFLLSLMALLASWFHPAAAANDRLAVGEAPFISGGPFFIARDKNYFDRLGIDIRTESFNDGALAVPALISGELDVSLVTMSAGLFNSIIKGAPIVIFLDRGNNDLGRGGSAINVTNTLFQAGLKGQAEIGMLKGRKVGVTAVGSINQYELALSLMQAGLDPRKDVTWVTGVSQPDLAKMLGRDLVDAADFGWQYGAYAASQGLGPIVVDGGTVDPDAQIGAYAALRGTMDAKHDAVVRFAMAIMYAAKEFNEVAGDPEHHPETLALLAKAAAAGKPELLKSFAPHWTSTSEDGTPNVKAIIRMQEFWVDYFRLGDRKVAPDAMIDLAIAKEAGARLAATHPFGP